MLFVPMGKTKMYVTAAKAVTKAKQKLKATAVKPSEKSTKAKAAKSAKAAAAKAKPNAPDFEVLSGKVKVNKVTEQSRAEDDDDEQQEERGSRPALLVDDMLRSIRRGHKGKKANIASIERGMERYVEFILKNGNIVLPCLSTGVFSAKSKASHEAKKAVAGMKKSKTKNAEAAEEVAAPKNASTDEKEALLGACRLV